MSPLVPRAHDRATESDVTTCDFMYEWPAGFENLLVPPGLMGLVTAAH
jgi:hypothetical protein